jgi:hypothetical protein
MDLLVPDEERKSEKNRKKEDHKVLETKFSVQFKTVDMEKGVLKACLEYVKELITFKAFRNS